MRKIILGLAPVLAAMSTSALAAAPAWKVSEVSGDVRVMENGRARVASKGALLGSGSTIATGAGARAVIVRGEEFVVISPRTQIRVPAESSPNRIMQLIEDFGTAVFKIQKKSTPHFGVQTPYLAAVVKGTTFTVSVGAEGSTVQVTEGAVQVSTLDGGAAELVRAGTIASVGASDLFRLTVDGEKSKVVQSPNGPSEGAGQKAGTGAGNGPAPHSAAYSGPRGQEVRIAKRLDEDSKSLSKVTKGLVDGNSAHETATAEFREQAKAARHEGKNPGYGDGNGGGKSDDKGKPADPGKPDDKGKPEDPGKPDDTGKPDNPSKPDDKGKPEDPGRPGDTGKPEDPGKPDDAGKPGDPGKPEDPGNSSKPDPSKPDPSKPDSSKPDSGKPDEAGKPIDPATPGNGDGGKGGPDEDVDLPGRGDGKDGSGKDDSAEDDSDKPGKDDGEDD